MNQPTLKNWQTSRRTIVTSPVPAVMGILNVTPDSFSDGGNWSDVDKALRHGERMADSGVQIIDIGGESTRPYSDPVDADEETRRVVPVIERLRECLDASNSSVAISIDTSKAFVAKRAIDAGAEIINDVTGLEGDPQMATVALEADAGVCAMHMQGSPQTMQDNPEYENAVTEIHDYLASRRDQLLSHGILPERICLDPGIGFGKTRDHNWELIRSAHRFCDLGHPILIGHSRKGFISKAVGESMEQRDAGTLALSIHLARAGVDVIRVHAAEATVAALKAYRLANGL